MRDIFIIVRWLARSLARSLLSKRGKEYDYKIR